MVDDEAVRDFELVKRLSKFNGLHVSVNDGQIMVATYQGVIFKGPVKDMLIEVEMAPHRRDNRRRSR